MVRRLAFTLFLAVLLVPLGSPAAADPGGLGSGAPGGSSGPSGARSLPAPPKAQPANPGHRARNLPVPARPKRPLEAAPKAEGGRKLDGMPGRSAAPGTATESPRSVPVAVDGDSGAVQMAFMSRAPRLDLREPSSAPSPGENTARRSGPTVYLARHSVSARIQDGVAVTELDQVYHNAGDRIGEGTWNCPLPRGAAVTGFSIYMNGVRHEGRFLHRSEARRIYDEIVRRRQDPGLVTLEADGSVTVQIFPIPAKGDMRIRMTWASLLPESGSVSHYLLPLREVAPRGTPALDGLTVDVAIETVLPLRKVFTPGLPLEEDPSSATNRWMGSLTRRDYRPSANVEVAYLLNTRSPELTVHVETGPDGTRTFCAVIQAGGYPLTGLALDFGGLPVTDVYPARLGKVAPWSRRYYFGRLPEGGPIDAELRAVADGEEVVLTTTAVESGGTHLGALWAIRKIEDMHGGDREKAGDKLVDFAERFGVLTRYNAILAEE